MNISQIKATPEQREQIKSFFSLITDHFQKILLYPILDSDGVERLGICVLSKFGDEPNDYTINMIGLLFLDEDKLAYKFNLKQPEPAVLTQKPNRNFIKRIIAMIKNKFKSTAVTVPVVREV